MTSSDVNSKLSAVVIYGATGYTGRLTVARLQQLGIPVILGGRSTARLEKLRQELKLPDTTRLVVADPTLPATLAALFQPPARVVINCVGPFTKFGEPVVRAALLAGVHYLDITGEQGYLARILTLYDLPAKRKGIAIVPACGVEYALTNWLATMAAEGLEPLEDIWTATTAKNVKASRGTQLSLLEALGQSSLTWKKGRRSLALTGSQRRTIDFPAPFGKRQAINAPFGESVTLPRHLQVENVTSYVALPASLVTAIKLSAPLLPVVSKLASGAIGWAARNPAETYTDAAQWAIMAQATGKNGGKRQLILQGQGVYPLTAKITTWCAMQMLQPNFSHAGALGPAQAFDAVAAVDFLQHECDISLTSQNV